jgi:hypothetical protein
MREGRAGLVEAAARGREVSGRQGYAAEGPLRHGDGPGVAELLAEAECAAGGLGGGPRVARPEVSVARATGEPRGQTAVAELHEQLMEDCSSDTAWGSSPFSQ